MHDTCTCLTSVLHEMFKRTLSIRRQVAALSFLVASLIIYHMQCLHCEAHVVCIIQAVTAHWLQCADNSQLLGLGPRGMLKVLATVCRKDTRQVLARLVSPSFNVRSAYEQPCRVQQLPAAVHGCASACQKRISLPVLIKLCSCCVWMHAYSCAEHP